MRLEDNALFHRLPHGWERYDPLVVLSGKRTRLTTKPWYSKEERQISRRPDGTTAVATPIFTVMDGDMFTIIWSPELPRSQPDQELEPEVEADNSSEGSDFIQFQSYVAKFLSYINYSDYFKRLIGPLMTPTDADLVDIANQISDQTLLVCSDGSFSPCSGTGCHAWVFSTPEGDILMKGAGPIDCLPQLLSSYRPEMGGITANLFILSVIVKLFGLTDGSVTLYCDNKSALETVFDPLLAVDCDLLLVARDLYRSLPVKIIAKHVKGHYTCDY